MFSLWSVFIGFCLDVLFLSSNRYFFISSHSIAWLTCLSRCLNVKVERTVLRHFYCFRFKFVDVIHQLFATVTFHRYLEGSLVWAFYWPSGGCGGGPSGISYDIAWYCMILVYRMHKSIQSSHIEAGGQERIYGSVKPTHRSNLIPYIWIS